MGTPIAVITAAERSSAVRVRSTSPLASMRVNSGISAATPAHRNAWIMGAQRVPSAYSVTRAGP